MKKGFIIILAIAVISGIIYSTSSGIFASEEPTSNTLSMTTEDLDNSLVPGYHIFGKWPFYTYVESDEYVVIKENKFSYDIQRYSPVVIPDGYVGVVTRLRDDAVLSNILYPGTYKLNLDKYTVEIVKKNPQIFVFGKKFR